MLYVLKTPTYIKTMFVAGYGGVYTGMAVEGEAMSGAKKAAKMAETQAIFEDESLVGALENRNVRKAVYIPTFFTNVPQQQPHPVAQRFSRDTQVPAVRVKSYTSCRWLSLGNDYLDLRRECKSIT